MKEFLIGIATFFVLFFVLFLVIGGLFGLLGGPELLVILIVSVAGAVTFTRRFRQRST